VPNGRRDELAPFNRLFGGVFDNDPFYGIERWCYLVGRDMLRSLMLPMVMVAPDAETGLSG
jgi:hypothetical protein